MCVQKLWMQVFPSEQFWNKLVFPSEQFWNKVPSEKKIQRVDNSIRDTDTVSKDFNFDGIVSTLFNRFIYLILSISSLC